MPSKNQARAHLLGRPNEFLLVFLSTAVKLLICGGRTYKDSFAFRDAMDELRSRGKGPTHIICGDAPGADELARRYAESECLPFDVFYADWQQHGKAAGPMRNQRMLEAKPDGVVAFPGGRGTADMVRRAEAAGVKVWKPYG
jgi:hypothetical protein